MIYVTDIVQVIMHQYYQVHVYVLYTIAAHVVSNA